MKSNLRALINQVRQLNKNMEKLSTALSSLEGIAKIYEIYVPSLNRKVKFKGFTTKQQKDAVKSALEKASTGLSFTLLLNSVLKENCQEQIEFLLADRGYIAVCLRALSLSSYINKENEKIDISFIVNNNLSIPDTLKTSELVDDNVKLDVSIPTLTLDSTVNVETQKKLAPISNNEELTKEAIGEIYINELVKYVNKITINNSGNLVEINFNELTTPQKVQVIERLPLSSNVKLIDYINSVKAFERKLFTNNSQEVEIGIDPSLFTV